MTSVHRATKFSPSIRSPSMHTYISISLYRLHQTALSFWRILPRYSSHYRQVHNAPFLSIIVLHFSIRCTIHSLALFVPMSFHILLFSFLLSSNTVPADEWIVEEERRFGHAQAAQLSTRYLFMSTFRQFQRQLVQLSSIHSKNTPVSKCKSMTLPPASSTMPLVETCATCIPVMLRKVTWTASKGMMGQTIAADVFG